MRRKTLAGCAAVSKDALSNLFEQLFGVPLHYLSLARFNQQVTTKFHLDGAPDQAFLLLGYEPTEIESRLAFADYSHAAYDLGITPKQFLDDYNPMFSKGEKQLIPYVTHLDGFDRSKTQILLINNSSQPYEDGSKNQLGVMHLATIENPSDESIRQVNSIMLTTDDGKNKSAVTEADVLQFLQSKAIN